MIKSSAMTKLIVSGELCAGVEPLLTPEPEKPRGVRPSISNQDCLRGIIFVLLSRLPAAARVGLRGGDDLLAAPEIVARGLFWKSRQKKT